MQRVVPARGAARLDRGHRADADGLPAAGRGDARAGGRVRDARAAAVRADRARARCRCACRACCSRSSSGIALYYALGVAGVLGTRLSRAAGVRAAASRCRCRRSASSTGCRALVAVPLAGAAVRVADGGRRHQRDRERARGGRRLPHARHPADRGLLDAGRRTLRRRRADDAVHRAAGLQAHGRAQRLHAADGHRHRPRRRARLPVRARRHCCRSRCSRRSSSTSRSTSPVQAFDATPRTHAPAVVFAFLPSIAYLVSIRLGNPWSCRRSSSRG